MDNSIIEFRYSLEDQWIQQVLVSRWKKDALDKARNILESPGFNWNVCRQTIRAHNLAPIIFASLSDRSLLPSEFQAELTRAYDRNRTRNVLYLNELRNILAILETDNIPVLVLKGAALIFSIYQDLGVRPMGDLDLLVHIQDLDRAIRSLSKIGFQLFGAEANRPGAAFENEVLLYKPGALGVYIELHWSFFDSPYYQNSLPLDWFWQCARLIQQEGFALRILDDEAQLLHLCAHLVLHHSGSEILWLHDIAELSVRSYSRLNWSSLLQHARSYNLLIPLQQTLLQIKNDWEIEFPPQFWNELQTTQPSPTEQRVVQSLTEVNRPVAQRFLDDIRFISGWRARLIFALENIFPSPAYMRYRYQITHPILLPLYYPYRWYLGLRSSL